MRNTGKRAFGALCSVVLAISVAAPGWSQVLAQQGYYADLSLDMIDPPAVYAGETVTLSAYVQSAGPDTVYAPVVLASTPWHLPTLVDGWVAQGPERYRLAIARIEPWTGRSVQMQVAVPPGQRAPFAIGMMAGSEAQDTHPGNELDAVALVPKVSTRFLFDVETTQLGDTVHWLVEATNVGPSSAEALTYSLAGPDAALGDLYCASTAGGYCSYGAGGLAPHSRLYFYLSAPMPQEEGIVALELRLATTEAADENRRVYSVPVYFDRSALLSDDFE